MRRATILATATALSVLATLSLEARAQDADPPATTGAATTEDGSAAEQDVAAPATDQTLPPDVGYYDESPLDYPQRVWRWYSRNTRPQRFAGRDLRRRYGYDPPFQGYGFGYGYRVYPWYGGFGGPAVGAPFADPGAAYIQGRHDERRFRDWKERYDKGRSRYTRAMTEGVRLFRETDYTAALAEFVDAARQNQGDPASRIHATYALVAIGNYDKAALMLRRAIELQPRTMYLPLSIREEYGPEVDFDAHFQRLRESAEAPGNDPDLWMLVGYYAFFSGDRPGARAALAKARDLVDDDYVINEMYEAADLLTPAAPRVPE